MGRIAGVVSNEELILKVWVQYAMLNATAYIIILNSILLKTRHKDVTTTCNDTAISIMKDNDE